ncbi:hypothetical protein BFL43_15580 [Williamsia sp. 1135]|nr:hypothetical protein BFL43_15580 [Williamsia sp. 1135]
MAKIVAVRYFDDLDDAPLDIVDLHTMEWSWAGVDYQFDTSTINLAKIEAGEISVAVLLQKSTRTGTTLKRLAFPSAPIGFDAAAERLRIGQIRTWARAQSRGVGDRGRLSREVIDAYNRAH